MILKLMYVNSLPALPFGAFKIGGELTINTEVDADKIYAEKIAERFELRKSLYCPDYEFKDPQTKEPIKSEFLNPFVLERCMREFLKRNHELMWNQVQGMPVEMFDIEQLQDERNRRR